MLSDCGMGNEDRIVKTVGIVGDHTMMFEGLAALVEGEPGHTCAWTCGDPAEGSGLFEGDCQDLRVLRAGAMGYIMKDAPKAFWRSP